MSKLASRLREVATKTRTGTEPTVKKSIQFNDEEETSSSSSSEDLQAVRQLKGRERIVINVGGQIHETLVSTLYRLPETRLAKLVQDFEEDKAYDPDTGMFYFNRNPIIFISVLQYYRTGELHIDHNICGNAIKNELEFWQIDPNDIEPCCWAQYAQNIENKKTLKMLDDSFAIYEDLFAMPEGEVGWRHLQRRLWQHIEDPSHSVVSKIFSALSILFVIVSILCYILESHSYFRVPRMLPFHSHNRTVFGFFSINGTIQNRTYNMLVNSTMVDEHEDSSFFEMTESSTMVVGWLNVVNLVCFAWFIFEYFIRLLLCPIKAQFFKSMLNNLDAVVLIAMCIETLASVLVYEIPPRLLHDFLHYLRILIALRFARIIRIMRLMKHYRAFKVLVYTIKVSLKELGLMVIFLMIGVVVFACLVYYFEPETFENIPLGCWWALITMTTVGYGDYHPKTLLGYFIGSVAAIFGVLLIAFTVPIVVNNFSLYYTHAQTRAKMRPKRRANKLLNKLAAIALFAPTNKDLLMAAEEEKNRHEQRRLKKSVSAKSNSVDSGVDDRQNRSSNTTLEGTKKPPSSIEAKPSAVSRRYSGLELEEFKRIAAARRHTTVGLAGKSKFGLPKTPSK